jgi:tetratricopeptide (TPR) repeat protein
VAADNLFPDYIPRNEEQAIAVAVERVRATGNSEAILLFGPGGVGKTRLVRELPVRLAAIGGVTWLAPIDLDDQEYWLLTNLQANVARQLDPTGEYFGKYTAYLSQPLASAREQITQEMAVSRLGHVRRIFLDCYGDYVRSSGKTVVMVVDTVEAIRGMSFLVTAAQWMKSLPGTLFVLSGRPMPDGGHKAAVDPIEEELAYLRRPIAVSKVPLGEFTRPMAERYLTESRVAVGLSNEERAKVILLTRGHPLWLALAVSYLDGSRLPQEADAALAAIEREIPYDGVMTPAGEQRHEEFKRRLMSPYKEADYWHEAVKRLAAVRQSVNEPMWRELMADRPLPEGIEGAADAWDRLMTIPWIRPRANGTSVTLHDAMAEELAKRILPMHDQSQRWRKALWLRMVANCDKQIADLEGPYTADMQKLDSRRQLTGDSSPPLGPDDGPAAGQGPLVREAARLDAEKRTIDQIKVQRFHYQLLCDFVAGCNYFLGEFKQAGHDQDLLFQDLLATAMLRYLSAGDAPGAFQDVDSDVIKEFRDWLETGHQGLYREIGIEVGEFLVASGQARSAIEVLAVLPLAGADARQLSHQKILLGNAYMRVPGEVKEGLHYLTEALQVSKDARLQPEDRHRLAAEAYKELGFYNRSVGRWREADEAYEHARDAILYALAVRRSDENRAELASIQSNWAYLKGLGGFYHDGLSLVESAIAVREQLGLRLAVGFSRSAQGEVYRYQQQFKKAWNAYAEAEQIFEDLRDPAWLGATYQKQAICLLQAHRDGLDLRPDPLTNAEELALKAVQICRERSVRNYPSALNRAGRIVGYRDRDEGLSLLAEGIQAGRAMSDGWFWLANLVEHAELCYRAWVETGADGYREAITRYEPELAFATSEYEFPDLLGRWEIVRAHASVREWAATGDDRLLDRALQDYISGFRRIAERGHVGSSGTSVIPDAFETFHELFRGLPGGVRSQWLNLLGIAWTGTQPGSTMLLARLAQLY